MTAVPSNAPTTNVLPPATFPTTCSLPFPDRRQRPENGSNPGVSGGERRQFGNSHNELSLAGKQLAEAIDHYKLQHRRRYITTDELLTVLNELGYQKKV